MVCLTRAIVLSSSGGGDRVTYGEPGPEPGLREHGMAYKLVYIAATALPRRLLVAGGIAAGVDIFLQQLWLGVLWGCLAGAGILLFGVAKIMDYEVLRGFPSAARTLASGLVSALAGAALVVGWIVFAASR